MTTACICYTTDASYLFPTFVSAIQARRNVSSNVADVVIFGFGIDTATAERFSAACARCGVIFTAHAMSAIGSAPAMMARLFLADLLPAQYDRFLYVDGDTQIHASLDELMSRPVPNGRFYAAADPMVFALDDTDSHGRQIAAHFREIGLSAQDARRYFNTGVIYANRAAWAEIGQEAWRRFDAQPAASRFPDQDVLNLVGLPHCLPLSLAWNFPVFMMNARVAPIIRPRIIHYMSQPKPWDGVFPPWQSADHRIYTDVAAAFPDLVERVGTMGVGQRLRYHLQQRYKRVLEMITWGHSAKRRRILAYEKGLSQHMRSDAPSQAAQRHAPLSAHV